MISRILNFTSEGDSFYAVKECKAIIASSSAEEKKKKLACRHAEK